MVGASTAQSRLDVAGVTGLTPLVGREHEVGLLRERWAQSQDGLGQVVLLSGEAGIGKSRLVRVLTERVVEERAVHLTLRCSPYHTNSAFYPVIEHLQRLLQWQRDTPAEEKLTTLEQALQTAGLPLAEVVPLLATLLTVPVPERYAPLTLSPQLQRQKTQAALLAWLLAEAAQQPVLTVWEDLHWADPSTLELLALMLDHVPTARLLLVLTARPEFRPPWALRSYVTPLILTRFTRLQIEEMILRVTDGKALPAEVVQQIVAKTDKQWSAWALWLLGYPAQALQMTRDTLHMAQEVSHPLTLAYATTFSATFHQFRRETARAKELAEGALRLATEQGYGGFMGWCRLCWARWSSRGTSRQALPGRERGLRPSGPLEPRYSCRFI